MVVHEWPGPDLRVPYLDAQDMLPGMTKQARYFALSYTGGSQCTGEGEGEGGRRVTRRAQAGAYTRPLFSST